MTREVRGEVALAVGTARLPIGQTGKPRLGDLGFPGLGTRFGCSLGARVLLQPHLRVPRASPLSPPGTLMSLSGTRGPMFSLKWHHQGSQSHLPLPSLSLSGDVTLKETSSPVWDSGYQTAKWIRIGCKKNAGCQPQLAPTSPSLDLLPHEVTFASRRAGFEPRAVDLSELQLNWAAGNRAGSPGAGCPLSAWEKDPRPP